MQSILNEVLMASASSVRFSPPYRDRSPGFEASGRSLFFDVRAEGSDVRWGEFLRLVLVNAHE